MANKSRMKRRRERKLKTLLSQLAEERKQLAALAADEDIKKRENQEYKVINLENKVDKQREKVNNLTRGVFEAPVLLDTFLASASASQIEAYLFNKGYFRNNVTAETRLGTHAGRFINRVKRGVGLKERKLTKAVLTYRVKQGNRVRINDIEYLIYDSTLAPLVITDSLRREIKTGRPYDGDDLARERERLYNVFRNSGYFNFSREYIYYGLDSALGGNIVDVYMGIANPPNRNRHRIYRFDKIYVESEYYLGDSTSKDTTFTNGYFFITNQPHVKPSILSDFIFLHSGDIFRLTDYQTTLTRLSQLNLFRFVDVQFQLDTIGRKDTGLLNAHIRLTPLKRQEYNTNLEFNYTDESQAQIINNRSLGISGSIVYKNKNIARSGLQLEIRPRAAIEVPITVLHGVRMPNFEYGISNSIIFPQLLLPWKVKDKTLRLASRTSLNLNFIFEENYYFSRTTLNTNLTYQWTKGRFTHFFTPTEINLVNTGFNNADFENLVKSTGDPLLINLFDQHIITDMRHTIVYGQQPLTTVTRPYWFIRNSIETGGNILQAASLLEDNSADTGFVKNILGINYYSYLRDEFDIRFYMPVWRENNLALRGLVGFGLPIWESNMLPFERRFYAGGANSMRAWRLRELGPGVYKDKTGIAFDKSGDLRMEGNVEFRFPLYGLFKSALFIDAGNVWTYKEDKARPGAKFELNEFYRQFAVAGGLGLRFDFTFFVLRLDLAVPVRDPSQNKGERIVIGNINSLPWLSGNTQLHLGIGYPF